MGLLRPAREMLSRYRKRSKRSFDGSVARFRRPTTPELGSYRPSGGIHHDLYNNDTPREYHPRLNQPAVQSTEYEPYDGWGTQHAMRSTDPRLFRNLDHTNEETRPPTYEHTAAMGEFFLRDMQEKYEAQREDLGATVSPDGIQQEPHIDDIGSDLESIARTPNEEERSHFFDMVDALGHLRTVLPEDHPDIVNLRTSVHHMLERAESWIPSDDFGPQDWQSNLGTGDPYENDDLEEAQQVFEEQLQAIEQTLESPELIPMDYQLPDIFDNPQAGLDSQPAEFDMIHDEFQPDDPFMEQQSLEEIVEHADPFDVAEQMFMEPEMMAGETSMDMGMSEMDDLQIDMAHDEIDQAIDQLSEPDPLQMPYDQSMVPEYMLDPEMQYMMQYMTPGAMPMGPMPGPAPGF